MTEIRFQLQQIPDFRWRLKERITDDYGEQHWIDRGVYESPAKGEEAIKIILSPTIKNYDPNGDEIR